MKPFLSLALLFTSISISIFAQDDQRLIGAELRSRKLWAKYLPAITAMAQKDWPNDEQVNASVLDHRYFSGLPTALIDLGCCGAYADDVYVIQIRNGKPFRPAFWSSKGPDAPVFGLGASTMHGVDVKFSTKSNRIVSTYWENSSNGENIANCSQDTYVWSVKRHRFEWHRELSYRRKAPDCGTVENRH